MHACLEVSDIHAALHDSPSTIAYVRDPDGVQLELL
jgi:hypothetical protein